MKLFEKTSGGDGDCRCGSCPSRKRPVSFHLDPNLSESVKTWLKKLIKLHGGTIDDRPRVYRLYDYLLIDPLDKTFVNPKDLYGKPEEKACGWTIVPACVMAKTVITKDISEGYLPLFGDYRDERASAGSPIRFFIHRKLAKELTAEKKKDLKRTIALLGGRKVKNVLDCQVIVAPKTLEKELRSWYSDQDDPAVETFEWLQKAVTLSKSLFKNPLTAGPSSRHRPEFTRLPHAPPRGKGGMYNKFTEVDDTRLVNYLASRCPTSALYISNPAWTVHFKELGRSNGRFPWASRHAWRAWRTRYLRDTEGFNKLIREARLKSLESSAANEPSSSTSCAPLWTSYTATYEPSQFNFRPGAQQQQPPAATSGPSGTSAIPTRSFRTNLISLNAAPPEIDSDEEAVARVATPRAASPVAGTSTNNTPIRLPFEVADDVSEEGSDPDDYEPFDAYGGYDSEEEFEEEYWPFSFW